MTTADSLFEGGVSRIIGKALRDFSQQTPPSLRPATINFEWSGGGTALVATTCDPILVEVPFDSNIVWAHLYAGDANGRPIKVTATVDLQLTQLAAFGVTTALYGTGATPSLTVQSSADTPVVGWQANLITGDAIVARLATFTGLATWLALTLQLRPTDVAIGVSTIVDNAGDTVVDSNGNTLVFRS